MSQRDFARLFSPPINQATVSMWERAGIPWNRLIEVEKATGIPRQELAPELFEGLVVVPDQSADAQ
jgi:hypothetical protein